MSVKNRIRRSILPAAVCAGLAIAGLGGCGREGGVSGVSADTGSADVSAISESQSVSESSRDAVAANSTESSSEIINRNLTKQSFRELEFYVPAEWAATKEEESSEEEGTANLDYYPSSKATVSFMYFDYSGDDTKDFPLAGVASGMADNLAGTEGASFVQGLRLLPSNADVCVYTVEGEYTYEEDGKSFFLNSIYYFVPGDEGVYQIWLSVDNDIDMAEYEKDFKEVFSGIVINGVKKEAGNVPKYKVFYEKALTALDPSYGIELSEVSQTSQDSGDDRNNDDPDAVSYEIKGNGESKNAVITFTDDQISLTASSISENDNLTYVEIALTEIIAVTSPETGSVNACYEAMDAMLQELTLNAENNAQYDIEYKKNMYHFTLDEDSLDLVVDIR